MDEGRGTDADGTGGSGCGETVLVLSDPTEPYVPVVGDGPTPRLFVTTDARTGVMEAVAGAERDPERFGHVDVGNGGVRSAAAADDPGGGLGPDRNLGGVVPEWYSHLADPDDLPLLARRIDEHLRRLTRDKSDTEGVELFFDSLTPYLSRVEGPALFRFLHVVGARVRSLGGTGYVLLDGTTDEETVARVAVLFDAVVERDGDRYVRREVPGAPPGDATDHADGRDRPSA
jgi:hypothetical protein